MKELNEMTEQEKAAHFERLFEGVCRLCDEHKGKDNLRKCYSCRRNVCSNLGCSSRVTVRVGAFRKAGVSHYKIDHENTWCCECQNGLKAVLKDVLKLEDDKDGSKQ